MVLGLSATTAWAEICLGIFESKAVCEARRAVEQEKKHCAKESWMRCDELSPRRDKKFERVYYACLDRVRCDCLERFRQPCSESDRKSAQQGSDARLD